MTQILSFSRVAEDATRDDKRGSAADAVISDLLDGKSLDRRAARALFSLIVEGTLSEPLMAAAFVALRVKGETAEELIGAALALRSAASRFPAPDYLFA